MAVLELERIDEREIRKHRLSRTCAELHRLDIPAIVLFDPINIRYATGSRNMQIWSMHNMCRYAFVSAARKVVLFDYGGAFHLSAKLETICERRPAVSWDYFGSGARSKEHATSWARQVCDLLVAEGGNCRRIAVDRLDTLPLLALQAQGVTILDGKEVMERARSIKSREEIKAIRHAMAICSDGVAEMRSHLRPGVRESDLLAVLNQANIRNGGEYQETRLLNSGPRTNPWFQETSDRVISSGELVAFDTDLIGRYGVFTDMSRTWLVGDGRPSDCQRRLCSLAREQLEHNIELLRPGIGLREFCERAWQMPDEFVRNRYAEMIHGMGLGVEYPLVYYKQDAEASQYDGEFREDMVICVESYIGSEKGGEGVKLEQPVLITEAGPEPLCEYPFEDDLG